MITEENVISIGKIIKVHGYSGEVVAELYNDYLEKVNTDFLFLKLNGLMIPFEYVSYREMGNNTVGISFAQYKTKEQSVELCGAELYLPKTDSMENTDYKVLSWKSFIGYSVYDQENVFKGKVVDVDDSSENILFYLESQERKELILPIHEDLLLEHIPEKRIMKMIIPEGLYMLNQ